MEQVLLETGKQIPALTVLCVLVFLFIRHIEGNNAAMRTTIENNNASMRETIMEIHKESMEARITQREVIRENTAAGKDNTIAMTRLTGAVENLTRKET